MPPSLRNTRRVWMRCPSRIARWLVSAADDEQTAYSRLLAVLAGLTDTRRPLEAAPSLPRLLIEPSVLAASIIKAVSRALATCVCKRRILGQFALYAHLPNPLMRAACRTLKLKHKTTITETDIAPSSCYTVLPRSVPSDGLPSSIHRILNQGSALVDLLPLLVCRLLRDRHRTPCPIPA